MKSFLVYVLLIITQVALADVAIHIEHPRYPSKQKDIYDVKCGKDCAVQIFSNDPMKGTASSEELEKKIRELFEKKPPVARQRLAKILYRIEATDGEKKLELVIGYPRSYEGEEYMKFSSVIMLVEEIKRKMAEEIKVKQ